MVPGLWHTHSVACALVVAMLDPIKFVDSYLEKLNDNLNGIFKFHYQSAVRRQGLKRIAEIFEDFKKICLLKNIRWIASRSRLFYSVESNYSILVYDLEEKSYNIYEATKFFIFSPFFTRSCGNHQTSFVEIPTKWFAILWNSTYDWRCLYYPRT